MLLCSPTALNVICWLRNRAINPGFSSNQQPLSQKFTAAGVCYSGQCTHKTLSQQVDSIWSFCVCSNWCTNTYSLQTCRCLWPSTQLLECTVPHSRTLQEVITQKEAFSLWNHAESSGFYLGEFTCMCCVRVCTALFLICQFIGILLASSFAWPQLTFWLQQACHQLKPNFKR